MLHHGRNIINKNHNKLMETLSCTVNNKSVQRYMAYYSKGWHCIVILLILLNQEANQYRHKNVSNKKGLYIINNSRKPSLSEVFAVQFNKWGSVFFLKVRYKLWFYLMCFFGITFILQCFIIYVAVLPRVQNIGCWPFKRYIWTCLCCS